MSTLTPTASSDAVAARMRSQRRHDTAPELAVRSALHRLGVRFRLPRRRLPVGDTTCLPDVAIVSLRVAVFVDGCYWHGCEEHVRPVKTNGEWWRAKIEATRIRDERQTKALIAAGWCVVRVWEHDDPQHAARIVAKAVHVRRWRRDHGLSLLGTGPYSVRRATA